MIIIIKIVFTISIILSILFIKSLIILMYDKKRVAREIAEEKINGFEFKSYVNSLKITPVVDFYSEKDGLKTEAGVSYYIEADDYRILLDLGENKNNEHPSPLYYNLQQLGLSLSNIDCIFISHCHPDHVGGRKDYKHKTFSVSGESVSLMNITVYSPVDIKPSYKNPGLDVQVKSKPFKIKDGIYSIGAIPRALYLLGYTLENSLAFNLKDKGIVLVVGCGHQTIEKIIERSHILFDEPIYGIIGGLHLPGGGGRMKIGPVDIQPIVGTDRYPWNKINEADTETAIETIRKDNPQIIALSPHDSSDFTLKRFQEEFGSRYRTIQVGSPIVI